MLRFVAKWYPLLALILLLPIGTTAGAVAGHGDPSLGHAVLPYVYPPWRFFDWLHTKGTIADGGPLQRVGITALATMTVLLLATFVAMLVERMRGRDFGWFINAAFFLLMLQNDVSNEFNAYNSNTNYLGKGGIMDRNARKNPRKPKHR